MSSPKMYTSTFRRKRTVPARVQSSLLPLESGRPSRAAASRSDLSTAIHAGAAVGNGHQNQARGTQLQLRAERRAIPRRLVI